MSDLTATYLKLNLKIEIAIFLFQVIDRHGNGSMLSDNHRISLADLMDSPNLSQAASAVEISQGFYHSTPELVALLSAYSIMFLLSLLGNSLVCYIVWKNKRLHTVTHMFIINLSASDILITIFNIPFNIARNLMDQWIFGQFMCAFINFILMVSVYVSTFTMMAIAIDRYIVILHPLRPRINIKWGGIIIVITWIAGALLSLPFALFSTELPVEMFFKTVVRCRICYPEPADLYERLITVGTFVMQYVIPMFITAVAYGQIVRCVWLREIVGQTTPVQQLSHEKTRRKTIKMLMIVVLIFSICWLPLNLYHMLTDFHPNKEFFSYNSTAYLTCHWLAMSSVCYNPLIYCWLHESFRKELRAKFACMFRQNTQIHPGTELDGILLRDDRASQRKSQRKRLRNNTPANSHNGNTQNGVTRPANDEDADERQRCIIGNFCVVKTKPNKETNKSQTPDTDSSAEKVVHKYKPPPNLNESARDSLLTSSTSAPNIGMLYESVEVTPKHDSHWV